jgi:DNA polymerase-3 subunit delta'
MAKIFSAQLNCYDPRPEDNCGVCPACRRTLQAAHPDVATIEPDGLSIRIDQIREKVHQQAHLKPMEGRYKIYIIDSAEMLTTEAANSLLKILEEPPSQVVLILVTAAPQSLLPTIRSRCQEIRFYPLPQSDLARWLVERSGCTPGEAARVARLAEGRPGEAMRCLTPERREYRTRILQLIAGLDQQHWSATAAEWVKLEGDLEEGLWQLLVWHRDQLMLTSGLPVQSIINQDYLELLRQGAARIPAGDLHRYCEEIIKAMQKVRRNVNPQLLLEQLLMTLSDFRTALRP